MNDGEAAERKKQKYWHGREIGKWRRGLSAKVPKMGAYEYEYDYFD